MTAGQSMRGALPALPVVLLLLIVFIYPVFTLLSTSVTEPQPGLHNYQKLLDQPVYLIVVWRTIWISVTVTTLCAVIGYPVAYYLASAPARIAAIALFALFIPFWASILVRTYGIMVIMGRTGVLNNALIAMGVIQRPIQFLFNTWIVIAAMVQILLPFFILPLYSVLKKIDPNLTRAASGLGAGGLRTFLRVYLPLSMPGVYAGGLIVMVFSFGFFIVPSLIGGRRDVTMPMLIIQQFEGQINWGFGAAIGTVLLVGTLAVIFVANWLTEGAKGGNR